MPPESTTEHIAAALRRQIDDGVLAPGALVPSEPELARQHQVSRQTARAALQLLEREGLLVVRPRRGRIVRSYNRLTWNLSHFELPDNTGLASSDAWENDVEQQGHDPTRQDLSVETIYPPPAIAERLRIAPDALCVVRRRVRYIDGHPSLISDDYFDEALVQGTELAEPRDTTREDILKEAGYEQTYDVDEIITRMPTPTEARRLALGAGEPVAEHTRTGYTPNDRAVRVMVSVIPGDTLTLRYVMPT